MRKTMICLANSKKYGERCIAGIEVRRNPKGGWQIVKKGEQPQWIRPVSNSEYGEVEETLVKDIRLLDVVEFEVIRPCPKGYQSENVLFKKNSFRKISSIRLSSNNLDTLCTKNASKIFTTTHRFIPKKKIDLFDYSLQLFKVDRIDIYYPVVYKTYNPRAKILYNTHIYDLPLTDINAIVELEKTPNLLQQYEQLYCTFSLGVAFEGKHYKIAAGIIYF